ncbi:MAG: 50S ribosomal protein L23 [Deltaproteobacteria bacterium]|nr:50S ribosomal protein L23 [Deltaproteobacteria bacterium]
MDMYSIIKKPVITEKSTFLREDGNKYIFEVASDATKVDIRAAVEKIFKVKVVDVHTISMKGKRKRLGRTMGRRKDWKKAVVTLAPGNSIEVFEGV